MFDVAISDHRRSFVLVSRKQDWCTNLLTHGCSLNMKLLQACRKYTVDRASCHQMRVVCIFIFPGLLAGCAS